MLLCIDVGNTTIGFGVVDEKEIRTEFKILTKENHSDQEYGEYILNNLKQAGMDWKTITGAVLSCVVPRVQQPLTEAVKKVFGIEPLLVNNTINLPIQIKTAIPEQVGADLIVDMAAAYGLLKRNVLVMDFGTASKFLYTDQQGNFKYVVIAPGLSGMANSLWGDAALLSEVKVEKPESILANETTWCLQAGISYGFIGMSEKILQRMKEEIQGDFPIIVTGGNAGLIVENTSSKHYDPMLAYKGMKLIYDLNK